MRFSPQGSRSNFRVVRNKSPPFQEIGFWHLVPNGLPTGRVDTKLEQAMEN